MRTTKAATAWAAAVLLLLAGGGAAAYVVSSTTRTSPPEDVDVIEPTEDGPRLVGRSGPAPGPAEALPPERRIQGRVVGADAEVVVSFQGYRHRMGYTTTWIAARETVPAGEGGVFEVGFPETDESIRSVFLAVVPPDGWIEPARTKLESGRVYVSVEIPSRIYHHRSWVSVPPPDGKRSWPWDPSNNWAVPEIRLVRAASVRGTALDPWGNQLPNVLVACLWPYRGLGLTRRLALTDERGCFEFEVPADGREIRLELCLRPTWGDVAALRPQAEPRAAPNAPDPPDSLVRPATPAPAHHSWPGTPAAVVRPGARGVVLQAQEGVVIEGQVVTEDGHPPARGEFYVQPADPTVWPVGYDHAAERSFGSEIRADGTFTLRGLQAGTWVVAFREHVEVETRRTDPPPLTGHLVVDAPSVGATITCRPAMWIDVTSDADVADEQWLVPLVTPVPEDWWETGAFPPLGRFLGKDHALRRSGRISTQAWNWWENAPGVLYVAAKDGRQALLRDVDPSRGEIHVTLEPGGVIRGSVVDYHTLGFLENGLGEYTPSIWVVARRGHLLREGRIQKGGGFEINALPPGRWDVSLQGEHIYEKNPRARRAGVPTGTEDLELRAR